MSKYIRKPPNLSIAKQLERMRSLHPQFSVHRFNAHQIFWTGAILPDPLSDTYRINIEYKLGKRPLIKAVNPDLRLIPDAKYLPHTYEGDFLCLYYPKHAEWHSGLLIADYVVPWISLWLFYYEMWLAKGEWLGGGTEHALRN